MTTRIENKYFSQNIWVGDVKTRIENEYFCQAIWVVNMKFLRRELFFQKLSSPIFPRGKCPSCQNNHVSLCIDASCKLCLQCCVNRHLICTSCFCHFSNFVNTLSPERSRLCCITEWKTAFDVDYVGEIGKYSSAAQDA